MNKILISLALLSSINVFSAEQAEQKTSTEETSNQNGLEQLNGSVCSPISQMSQLHEMERIDSPSPYTTETEEEFFGQHYDDICQPTQASNSGRRAVHHRLAAHVDSAHAAVATETEEDFSNLYGDHGFTRMAPVPAAAAAAVATNPHGLTLENATYRHPSTTGEVLPSDGIYVAPAIAGSANDNSAVDERAALQKSADANGGDVKVKIEDKAKAQAEENKIKKFLALLQNIDERIHLALIAMISSYVGYNDVTKAKKEVLMPLIIYIAWPYLKTLFVEDEPSYGFTNRKSARFTVATSTLPLGILANPQLRHTLVK